MKKNGSTRPGTGSAFSAPLGVASADLERNAVVVTEADDAPTRQRVAHIILQIGPSTATELAEHMELTPAAVRRHLDELIDDGIIEAREQRITGRRGRGRPAKEFCITESGRDHFPHAYDEFAVEAMRFLEALGGQSEVGRFAYERLEQTEHRYAALLDDVPSTQRPEKLAEALTKDGFAATAVRVTQGETSGVQLCQHHCPIAHVAEQFSDICEAEAQMFSRLLGSHVQRLATIAHGDGVCTTFQPEPQNQSASGAHTDRTSTVGRLSS